MAYNRLNDGRGKISVPKFSTSGVPGTVISWCEYLRLQAKSEVQYSNKVLKPLPADIKFPITPKICYYMEWTDNNKVVSGKFCSHNLRHIINLIQNNKPGRVVVFISRPDSGDEVLLNKREEVIT